MKTITLLLLLILSMSSFSSEQDSQTTESIYCYGKTWDDSDPNNPVWRRVYVYGNGTISISDKPGWCAYCPEPAEPQGIPCGDM